VAPAGKGLEGDDAVGRQLDDRLVVQLECLLDDGQPQLFLTLEAAAGAHPHRRIEDGMARLARDLATYIAASALASRSSATVARASASAMPTLALMTSERPSMSTGRRSSSASRSAVAIAPSTPSMLSSRTVNSSPPWRPATSPRG